MADLPFTAAGSVAAAARAFAPYLTIQRNGSRAAPALSVVGVAGVHGRVREYFTSLDAQAWNETPGRPVLGPRGEGYRFFRLSSGDFVGRFRYPLDRDAEDVYVIKSERSQWIVIHRGGSTAAQLAGLRVVRTFHSRANALAGAFAIHASAFTLPDGSAVLLCGAKGAGKTTNLVAALCSIDGAAFLTNDRVWLDPRSSVIMACGSPHAVPVRHGTLTLFPALSGAGRDREASGARVMADRRSVSRGADKDDQLILSPTEFVQRLGVTVRPMGRLRAVVILEDEPRARRPWSRLSASQGALALASHEHRHYEPAQPFFTQLLGPMPRLAERGELPGSVETWRLNSRSDLRRAWTSCPLWALQVGMR